MRHYISVDMEGISGIASWNEMEKDVKRVNDLMTQEVNAVIEGIIAGDPSAEEILVCDAHGYGDNIYPEKLNKKATIVRGTPRRNYMMVGIDSRFNLSYYIGYHCAAGTISGAMDHTFSGASIRELKINDQVVGEFELNGGYAGSLGVKIALASGDSHFCNNVASLKLGALTVMTKIADTRFCSTLFHPDMVSEELRTKATEAVKLGVSSFKTLVFNSPYTVTVDLTNSIKADMASLIPVVKRVSGTRVQYTVDNYPDLYNMFEAIVCLAGSAK